LQFRSANIAGEVAKIHEIARQRGGVAVFRFEALAEQDFAALGSFSRTAGG
jgi:hypothetical protein